MALNKRKKFVVLSGYLFSLALVVTFLYTFISAYISPKKNVMVYINNYNEAHIELILLIPITILIFIGVIIFGLDYYREYKTR